MSDIHKRVMKVINYYGLNVNNFSKEIGLNNNVTIDRIVKAKSAPSHAVITRILTRFKDIDANWLIQGKGAMEIKKNDASNNNVVQSTKRLKTVIVRGDEMLPTYASGTELSLKEIKGFRETLIPNKPYWVRTKEQIFFRYLKGNGDKLIAYSLNPDFEEFEVSKDDIISIWSVVSRYFEEA